MTAGPVNRALLESFFQQSGQIYDDTKTEGAIDVLADQTDENWSYIANLVSNQTLINLNIYVVTLYGLVGDGVSDDTAALQTLINTAIAAGRKAIYFPHTTTGGQYRVTALTNADQVVFYGDNASFVGGYTGYIEQVGMQSSGKTYLVAFNGAGNVGSSSGNYAIGLAATRDKEFFLVNENTMFSPTQVTGDFDKDSVKDPYLVKVGDTVFMYYTGYNSTLAQQRIGLATLNLTRPSIGESRISFTRNPSFPLDFGTGGYQNFPKLLYEPTDTGKEFKMWFSSGAPGFTGLEIYYAYSSNGINWTLHGKVLSKGASGDWDDNFIQPTYVKKIGGTYYLFYAGFKTGERQKAGFATFTDPQGTYTKHGNPILTRKNQRQTLTSNLNVGSRTVQVADTSIFTEGMTVWVADNQTSDNFETNRIYKITNSTSLTLEFPAKSSYTTAASGTIHGIENGSLYVSFMDYELGVYKIYGTAFQLGDVGTTIGGYLIETTFYAEGLTLDSLNVIHNRSPILGMSRGTDKWDRKSRENPCIIELNQDYNAFDLINNSTDLASRPISRLELIPLRPSGYGSSGLSVTSSTFAVQGYRVFPGTNSYPLNAVFTLVIILGVANIATTAEYRLASDGAGTIYGTATSNALGRNKVRKALSNLPTVETIIQEDFRSVDNVNGAIVYSAYIEVSW